MENIKPGCILTSTLAHLETSRQKQSRRAQNRFHLSEERTVSGELLSHVHDSELSGEVIIAMNANALKTVYLIQRVPSPPNDSRRESSRIVP